MKNLFDFANEDLSTSDDNKSEMTNNFGENINNFDSINDDTKKDAKDLYEKYKNYSQDELLKEFISSSKTKLKDGSLTKEKINNTINSLSPFLNNSQAEYLKQLIGKLDD